MNLAQFQQALQEPPPPLGFQVLGWPYLGLHKEVILFAAQQSIMFLVEDKTARFHFISRISVFSPIRDALADNSRG